MAEGGRNTWIEISPEFFGVLWQFVDNDDITDIDYNGNELWIRDYNNNRKKVTDIEISQNFIRQFTQRIANSVSKEFNKQHPVLEAETKRLRISIVHESVAVTGRSICIRKTLPVARITAKKAVESGYVSKEMLSFLVNCVKAHMNLTICGEPGVGKTECAKFLSGYIPDKERVITIEDNLEWHYHQIKPYADCVELQVSELFGYQDAIVTSLRQNPKWLMVSEVRGEEVASYIQQLTTGVNGITTLHTDDVRKVPERLVNMAADRIGRERMESDIYSFLDVAVLIRIKRNEEGKERRYLDQLCLFENKNQKLQSSLIFDNGQLVTGELSEDIKNKFLRAGIREPFLCREIEEELRWKNQRGSIKRPVII